ncbi:hypothetical protein JCM11641_007983 [Rhodosporidiobolus odoratus]
MPSAVSDTERAPSPPPSLSSLAHVPVIGLAPALLHSRACRPPPFPPTSSMIPIDSPLFGGLYYDPDNGMVVWESTEGQGDMPPTYSEVDWEGQEDEEDVGQCEPFERACRGMLRRTDLAKLLQRLRHWNEAKEPISVGAGSDADEEEPRGHVCSVSCALPRNISISGAGPVLQHVDSSGDAIRPLRLPLSRRRGLTHPRPHKPARPRPRARSSTDDRSTYDDVDEDTPLGRLPRNHFNLLNRLSSTRTRLPPDHPDLVDSTQTSRIQGPRCDPLLRKSPQPVGANSGSASSGNDLPPPRPRLIQTSPTESSHARSGLSDDTFSTLASSDPSPFARLRRILPRLPKMGVVAPSAYYPEGRSAHSESSLSTTFFSLLPA